MEITQQKLKELAKIIKDNGVYLNYKVWGTQHTNKYNKDENFQIHPVDPSAQHNLLKAIEQAPTEFSCVEIVYSHEHKPIWTNKSGAAELNDQGCKDLVDYAKSMKKSR